MSRMDIPELDIADRAERAIAMRARFGKPEWYDDQAGALRLLGRRDEIHPDDVQTYRYPTRECAEAFAAANHWQGDTTLGIAEHDGWWLGGVDLRPCYAEYNRVTDPAVADDGGFAWRQERKEARQAAAAR